MSEKVPIESRYEIESILREEKVGYLGMSVEEKPYVVPLNYGYVEGKILFHCALTGKKLEYLKRNPQVCFTVGRQSSRLVRHPQGAHCPIDTDSVICYGMARIVEAPQDKQKLLNIYNRCLQPDAEEIPAEAISNCCAVEIKITEMTGRQQRGLKHQHWKYQFEK